MRFVVAVSLLAVAVLAAQEFPATRLFQADELSTSVFGKKGAAEVSLRLGAQRSAMEGAVIAWPAAQKVAADGGAGGNKNTTFARRVIVVDAAELPFDAAEVARIANAHAAAGVLFVVPRSGFPSDSAEAAWRQAERSLLGQQFLGAVFLAWREDVPAEVLLSSSSSAADGKSSSSSSLTLSSVAPKAPAAAAADAETQINVVATLPGRETSDAAPSLPTVAVVAHSDTFSAFPGAAVAGGGALAVLLELARIFGRIHHANALSRPRCNVVFVAASGAPVNFGGLAAWVDSLPPETSVDFVLCLDAALADESQQPLRLHVSKPPKDAAVRRVYEAFTDQKPHGIAAVSMAQKKVNVAETEAVWPHEILAVRRILGATLSQRQTPASPPLRAHWSVLDGRRVADNVAVLGNVTRMVAEALARIVFPSSVEAAGRVVEGSVFDPDQEMLAEWARLFSTHSRAFPAAASSGSPLVAALHSALSATTAETTEMQWTYHANARAAAAQQANARAATPTVELAEGALDGEDARGRAAVVAFAEAETRTRFYSASSTPVTIVAHRKAPPVWDLWVAAGVVAVLFVVYAALKGFGAMIRQILSLFARTPSMSHQQQQKKKKN